MSASKRNRKTITAIKVCSTDKFSNKHITTQINERPQILRTYENTITSY